MAFVKHYVALINYVSHRGKTHELRRLARACKQCDAIADLIDRVYGTGGRITGDGWIVLSARQVPNISQDGITFVDSTVKVSSQQVYETPSSTPRNYAGRAARSVVFSLVYGPTQWKVTAISIVSDR